ncbi:unnamed protein product [Allacma fusca]|uniref:Prolyl 4-hydroxylase N-terminal domain-containing protein n=1 Tax=Allacma fusca TaxID=39272 RepID=A0A8J2PMJ9_9HEXA|nr:unnamed protein product [Allacma fusca]
MNGSTFMPNFRDGKYQQNATGTSVVSLCAYLLEYDDSRSNLQNICTNGEEAVDSVTNNPLASYLMIRRALIELTNFQEAVCKHEGSHSYFKNALRSFSHLPTLTMEDLRDASLAILRIGHVYGLQAQQIANGILMGMDIQVKLRAHLILQTMEQLKWLFCNMAMTMQYNSMTKHFERDHQKTTPMFMTENWGQLKTTNILEAFGKTHEPSRDIQNPEVKSRLFCWYERSGPYLKIAPVKMEYLSKDPDVIHMYDVIGAKMITRLKALVSNNLRLSKGANYAQPYSPMLTATRTSVQNWVDDKKYKDLEILARDIEQFTKLSVYPKTSSELFQVAAYTFSGHYDFHLDAFKPNYSRIAENGNRIATFMYYVSLF